VFDGFDGHKFEWRVTSVRSSGESGEEIMGR
jgi:hypothetical protein